MIHRLLLALFVACAPALAAADTFVVSTVTDGGPGSLRAAIMAANANAGSDTIVIPVGTYLLSIPGTSEDAAATGDLDITDGLGQLLLQGAGASGTIIDGAGLDSVFHVFTIATADFRDLTIQGGDGGSSQGGGIHSEGFTFMTRCEVRDNVATFGGGVRLADPNAILSATESTFAGNTGFGNAIESDQAIIDVRNSTVSGNFGTGGAIRLTNAASVELNNSTVVDNASEGLVVAGGVAIARVGSSILAGNNGGGADVSGSSIQSSDHNFIGDAGSTTVFIKAGDQAGSSGSPLDPQLGPLASNGGPTRTHLPEPGSAVVDAGSNFLFLDTDQRGEARVLGLAPDVGSVENENAVNRFVNSTFDTDVTGWNGFPLFSSDDADGDPNSGALEARAFCATPVCGRLVGQCVEVAGGTDYYSGGDWRIPPQTPTGQVAWRIIWYSDTACSDVVGFQSGPTLDVQGDWVGFEDTSTAPLAARSGLVGGNFTNFSGGTESFVIRMDNLIFAPEPSAATSLAAGLVALCALRTRKGKNNR